MAYGVRRRVGDETSNCAQPIGCGCCQEVPPVAGCHWWARPGRDPPRAFGAGAPLIAEIAGRF